MAIKREKKLIDYQTKIGVNRGAGIATAANNAARESQIFDQILNDAADKNLVRLKKRGEKLGKEAAVKTIFDSVSTEIEVDGVKKIVNVPVRPPTPLGMGITEAEVYEKNVVNIYNNRMKTDIDSEIIEASKEAVFNNATPDMFDKDIDARLKPYFDAMADGSHQEEMRIYSQNRKDVHGYKVFTNHRTNLSDNAIASYTVNRNGLIQELNNRYRTDDINYQEYKERLTSYTKNLKTSGINTTKQELENKVMLEAYKLGGEFWKEYPVLKSDSDISKLHRLIKDETESITLSDKRIVTKKDLLKYIDNPTTAKLIAKDLKVLDIFNNEDYMQRHRRTKFNTDFTLGVEAVLDGRPFTSSISADPKEFGKYYSKNPMYYNQILDSQITLSGEEPTELRRYEVMLKAHGFIPEILREDMKSFLITPSKESLITIMPYLSIASDYKLENREFKMEGFNARQSRQLNYVAHIYKSSNKDVETTFDIYDDLKDKLDDKGDITNIIRNNLQSSSEINSRKDLERFVRDNLKTQDILGSIGAYSVPDDFIQEVIREVEITILTNKVIVEDTEYDPIIGKAVNQVLAYKDYSISGSTAPRFIANEFLHIDVEQKFQRRRVVKNGAEANYGVYPQGYDVEQESTGLTINYMHQIIIDKLKKVDPESLPGFEKSDLSRLIQNLENNKGTEKFFYNDQEEDLHINLIPESDNYLRGQKPEYHIGIFNPGDGNYIPLQNGNTPVYLKLSREEFEKERDDYIIKLKEERKQ
jgi:hypothetical protein